MGIEALAAVADVTRAADIAALLERVHAGLGPIDILINNAGMGIFGPFHERSEDEWDTVLNTNLKSVFLVSRAVAPEMMRPPARHHIVNISSLAGKNAFPNGGLYCASKWGLMGLTYCMAEELRVHSVRVGVICPGSVATEFSPHSGRNPATLLQPDDSRASGGRNPSRRRQPALSAKFCCGQRKNPDASSVRDGGRFRGLRKAVSASTGCSFR